ncbi:VOC family protein [Pseudonocardia sp. DSM 110487]|uniref:VOC family protein n=1 Tax=Pseudonocardia sp. DSM 110487 TaxID=2865833 RepID=UPI001C6A7E4D|nr:VOC family protein [Pseudonocardia sp. DSM 110487]QYN33822.1 VOC family protein [Pseudonocardia sp. DSM 110487]
MPLHRLSSLTIGVPDVATVAGYYADFGLEQVAPGRFATADGGEQLRLEYAPSRRLLALEIGVDDVEDLERAKRNLDRFGVPTQRAGGSLSAVEPVIGVRATLRVTPHLIQSPIPATPYNGPGRADRPNVRAPGILREGRVRPRKLGHVVIGSTDEEATRGFFTDGLGFKVSDRVPGLAAFMRCSTDHHNVLVNSAPVSFLHHTAWQVDDVDEVGRGASAMLEEHPERHVWGLGRHHVGSNFFWYLKDPAGNFSEYYSDLDEIIDDQLWNPETVEGARGMFNWGPPPPPSFIHPEDLAGLMTGAHSAG